jgi:DNA uptake protein ComE-like DNA-binding protein
MMNRSHSRASTLGSAALLALLTACGGGAGDGADSAAATLDTTATAAPAPAATTASATDSVAAGTAASGMLDPESAPRAQLLAVPGMTPAAADAVIASRPHATMVDVDRALAPHLSEAERDTVYAVIWKPIDLNSATADEILLIPGVGPRMRHEFEEYRPYNSMAKFRREIGKYVKPDEVARLEKYVMIRQ